MHFFRSDFFTGLLRASFKENTERSGKLNMSAKAVEQLVKFVYGFDIDIDLRSFVGDNDDWKALKELLIYGGVYGLDGLQKAAEKHLSNHLIYVNVIQFLEFAKEQKLYGTIKVCTEFAARHNNQIIDLSKDTLMRHPEIAIEMVENRNLVNNCHTMHGVLGFQTEGSTTPLQGDNCS